MGRVALTLWFTITTLLGPGVCCCNFATSPPTQSPDLKPAPVTKATKSCCHKEALQDVDHGRQKHEPVKPSKCPCEHAKRVNALPVAGQANADISTDLRLLDTLFVGIPPWVEHDLEAPTPVLAGATQPVSRLAGRDLLAAYSTLRC
ncbi:unnamed protein product [Gemmataceae bacterium]|nr:unnamed protein product [Gemmataceae bacterium]VTU01452.1 unnamed protein product [Gemmataceae bacterium]